MIKQQKGMTGISILIVVIGIVFVASLALKVVPIYVDDTTIKNIVASYDNKADMRGKTHKSVMENFQKKLKINNVNNFDMDNVSLTKEGSDYLLVVDYEPRGELIGSLEYIVHFTHEARFPSN